MKVSAVQLPCVLANVNHEFLTGGYNVAYLDGCANTLLVNNKVVVVVKKAEDVFHKNTNQFCATKGWIDANNQLSLEYDVFVTCFCANANRFCTLTWAELTKMHADRLKSFGVEGEEQFPFRVEVISSKGFTAFALGGGRKDNRIGCVKKSTGLITGEIKKLAK